MQILSIFHIVICQRHDYDGVLSFDVFRESKTCYFYTDKSILWVLIEIALVR